MFDQLSDRLQATLSDVRSRGKLSEADVDAAMREIRLALLEADVNFKVVKSFTATLKERCLGADVLESLDPGQQVVKIVNEELAALMGGTGRELALRLQRPDRDPDGRPAGLRQDDRLREARPPLRRVRARTSPSPPATSTGRPRSSSWSPSASAPAPTSTSRAPTPTRSRSPPGRSSSAREERRDVLIIDTAGRLHIDQELMAELARIRKRTKPHDVLLVVDAMTGQDAVGVAESFAEAAEFDGVVMTKLDGDARGGAALSVKAVTGKPILFASTPAQ